MQTQLLKREFVNIMKENIGPEEYIYNIFYSQIDHDIYIEKPVISCE